MTPIPKINENGKQKYMMNVTFKTALNHNDYYPMPPCFALSLCPTLQLDLSGLLRGPCRKGLSILPGPGVLPTKGPLHCASHRYVLVALALHGPDPLRSMPARSLSLLPKIPWNSKEG